MCLSILVQESLETVAATMATAEDLAVATSERTAAKRAVTMAAKRVRQGVELNMGTVDDMVRTLDAKLIDFLDICEKFNDLTIDSSPDKTTVNGLTPSDYEKEII